MNDTQNSSSPLLANATMFGCQSSFGLTFYTVVGAMDFTLGFSSTAWSLWFLIRGGQTLLESEIFNLNLFTVEMVNLIIYMLNVLNIYLLRNNYINGALTLLYGLSSAGRALLQCCICLERYLAVVHPVTFLKFKPLRYRVACLMILWPIVLGFAVTFFLLPSHIVYLFLAMFLPVLSVELFCSLSILRVLKRPSPGAGEREREGTNVMKKTAFVIVSLILMMMVVNYLPLISTAPLTALIPVFFYCNILPINLSLFQIGSFVHPLLYLHRAGKLTFIRCF